MVLGEDGGGVRGRHDVMGRERDGVRGGGVSNLKFQPK